MTLSVRHRIVIWYTLWMVLLIVLVFIGIFSGSSYLVERRTKAGVVRAVNEAVDEIEYTEGWLDFDNVDFRRGGVYIILYDNDGFRIAGFAPDEVPYTAFSDGILRTLTSGRNSWYIYDSQLSFSDEDSIWVRGIIGSYDMRAVVSSMQGVLLIVLPILVLMAALGGYLIVKRSFRPIDRIIKTAEEIAEGNDLKKRIGLRDGSSELYKAASAFDRMLDRIEATFEKEKQFTSDASHELRTPIAVILAASDYALSHTDDSSMKETLSVISDQAGRMSSLVSELLYIARADKGTLHLEKEDVDVSELIEIVAETMEDKAASKNISIHAGDSEAIIVKADRDMLMRVLINLISNAITYGNDGGNVWVSAEEDHGNVVIKVHDDGIGIAPEHLARIWDRFYQEDPARSGGNGSGLGLSIVKEIVSLHGGTVFAESIKGEGSTFYAEIPDGSSLI